MKLVTSQEFMPLFFSGASTSWQACARRQTSFVVVLQLEEWGGQVPRLQHGLARKGAERVCYRGRGPTLFVLSRVNRWYADCHLCFIYDLLLQNQVVCWDRSFRPSHSPLVVSHVTF